MPSDAIQLNPFNCQLDLHRNQFSSQLRSVVNPGHGSGEAQGGVPYDDGLEPVRGTRLCLPQPHLRHLGGSLRRRRDASPPADGEEGRQLPREVGGEFTVSI